jgi:hypothetical protein
MFIGQRQHLSVSSVDLSLAVAVPVSIWRCDVSDGASILSNHSYSFANGSDSVSPSVLFAGNFYRKGYIEMATDTKKRERERDVLWDLNLFFVER